MAIGDAVGFYLGAAAASHQPSSGVEEKLTAIIKGSTSDAAQVSNGSSDQNIFVGTADLALAGTNHNIAVMLTNAIYYQKQGSSDIQVGIGVQTNV